MLDSNWMCETTPGNHPNATSTLAPSYSDTLSTTLFLLPLPSRPSPVPFAHSQLILYSFEQQRLYGHTRQLPARPQPKALGEARRVGFWSRRPQRRRIGRSGEPRPSDIVSSPGGSAGRVPASEPVRLANRARPSISPTAGGLDPIPNDGGLGRVRPSETGQWAAGRAGTDDQIVLQARPCRVGRLGAPR